MECEQDMDVANTPNNSKKQTVMDKYIKEALSEKWSKGL